LFCHPYNRTNTCTAHTLTRTQLLADWNVCALLLPFSIHICCQRFLLINWKARTQLHLHFLLAWAALLLDNNNEWQILFGLAKNSNMHSWEGAGAFHFPFPLHICTFLSVSITCSAALTLFTCQSAAKIRGSNKQIKTCYI